MTIPMWSPFAALVVVGVFCPPPAWARRIDWVIVAGWLGALMFSLAVWYGVFRLVWWVA